MAIPIADAGSDQTFAFSALPTTANLTGSGTDPDLGAITGYLWAILEKPTGSSAALSSITAQNPTLNSIDTPGTYMLFLVVTDDQAESSDDNPLTAPESARVHINVQTEHADLVKPAPGERGWQDKYYDVVDAVDQLREDVDDLGPASARGEFAVYVTGTQLTFGFNPSIVDVPIVTNESEAHAAWEIANNIYVDSLAIQLADAGSSGATWTFSLYEVTPAEYEANTYLGGSQIATINVTASAAHGPEAAKVTLGTPAEVDAGNILALLVEDAPLQNAPTEEPGTGLNVTVAWRNRT